MKLLFLTVALFLFSLLIVSAQQKKEIFRFPAQVNDIRDTSLSLNGFTVACDKGFLCIESPQMVIKNYSFS